MVLMGWKAHNCPQKGVVVLPGSFSLSIVQLQLNVWYEFKPWTGGIAGRKAKVVFYSLLHDATPARLLQSLGIRISLWGVGGRLW